MKRLSIKLRVTLWFTGFMMILVIMVSMFLLLTGKKLERANSQNRVREIVEDVFDKNESHEEEDEFHGFNEGVYVSIYDMEGNLLSGDVPDGFDEVISFKNNETRTVTSNDKKWYVYDKECYTKHSEPVWVRGIISDEKEHSFVGTLMHLFVYALPFFVIAIAIGGYYIISRAFKPINRIIVAADKIGEGKDLSQRINLGEGKDEIYTLAATFDRMFDRLEDFFEHEKQFTSDASHELRTPTAVIIAQCEYALENANTVEESKEAFDKIMEQAKKMSALIAQLLTLARADQGQEKLNLELINLSELAEIVIEHQTELAEQKNITITHKIESNLLMKADETMLMRLMINLIENGINYGKYGGNLRVELEKQNQNIAFCVIDDGIGISPEHLTKIWERFYQVDASRNPSNNSVGLGLSMVKWIAKAHGGEVFVKSEPSRETIFTVVLPVNDKE